LFGAPAERFATAPNGYDATRVRYTPCEERASLRARVGLHRFTALFVGSEHPPNIAAARAAVSAAENVPEVRMLVVGAAGLGLEDVALPANVDVTGPVHAAFLRAVLSLADVALNPVASGSGTNVKMLEYAGAGAPVISTTFGARGLGFARGEHYAPAEPTQLAAAIEAVAEEPRAETRRRAERAHARVSAEFEWGTIARRWLGTDAVSELLGLA
jgi:glycosyltransferase involved in cell wall biosynthesis